MKPKEGMNQRKKLSQAEKTQDCWEKQIKQMSARGSS